MAPKPLPPEQIKSLPTTIGIRENEPQTDWPKLLTWLAIVVFCAAFWFGTVVAIEALLG